MGIFLSKGIGAFSILGGAILLGVIGLIAYQAYNKSKSEDTSECSKIKDWSIGEAVVCWVLTVICLIGFLIYLVL